MSWYHYYLIVGVVFSTRPLFDAKFWIMIEGIRMREIITGSIIVTIIWPYYLAGAVFAAGRKK